MAPSTDACCICLRVFYGKQPRLRCTGCVHRVHQKCLMLPDSELQLLTSGVSPFFCSHCKRSSSPSPNEGTARVSEESGIDGANDGGREEGGSPSLITSFVALAASQGRDLEAPPNLLHGLLLDALEGISFLTDQVACLNEDNRRLKAEVAKSSGQQAALLRSLRAEVSACRAEIADLKRAAGAPSYAAVAQCRSVPAGLRGGTPSPPVASSHMSPPSSSMASSEATVSCPTVPLAEPSEGSAILLARPVEIKASRLQTKPVALIGSSEISRLTVVPSSPRRKALFVTKLSPETTAANITEHLASVGVQSVQCSRLKTRFDTYASFYVSVEAEAFGSLTNPATWPRSCLFKPFRGRLRDDLLFNPGDLNDSATQIK
ncbi:hypothetical protein HPB47_025075 [Ixodes persulcatus]|uniref:Uncharacterized protein n=1 Tax=Ixodes persulcatus TaxID=34615 RepID=A0AC60Q2Z3_IXOPE|nr:hypothetical protein HPB47_025075 [Ixodes persulcatus]